MNAVIHYKSSNNNTYASWVYKTYTDVRNGCIFTENLGQELDSGTLVITNVSESDDIELHPYDRVLVNDKCYLIASYEKSYISYDPIKYQYTINLMSLTKLLEIPVPSMTITQVGTSVTYNAFLNKIVSIVNDMYNQKIIDIQLSLNSNNIPFLNEAVPELVFTTPTIREVLTQVFSVKGCLPILKYNNDNRCNLDILDLNARKSECDTQYFVEKKMSNSAENYATTLVSNIDNAVGDRTVTEYIKLQCDGAEFTSETMTLRTQYPIYDIKSVKVKNVIFSMQYLDGDTYRTAIATMKDVDITKFVLQKEIYETRKVLNRGGCWVNLIDDERYGCSTGRLYDNDGLPFKNNSLAWEKGTNKISYLSYKQEEQRLFTKFEDLIAIFQAIASSLQKEYNYNIVYSTLFSDDDWYKSIQFEITYKPYVSMNVAHIQQTSFKNPFLMINEVQESIDLHSFGRNALEKNKQLGNDNLLLYATTPTTYNYEIGQTLGDYVLTKTEAQIYPNKTMWTLGFTKYFTSESAYTLLDRQKRYYTLANNEYIDRKISKIQRLQIKNGITSAPFYDKAEMMHLMFGTSDGIRYFRLKPMIAYSGNAWIYSVQMADATNIGFFRTEDTIEGDDVTIETSQGLQYVDSYGKTNNLYVGLRTESAQEKSDGGGCWLGRLSNGWNKPYYYKGGDSDWTWSLTYSLSAFNDLSSKNGGTLIDNQQLVVSKDTREKLTITMQYTLESGNSNIFIGENIGSIFGTDFLIAYAFDKTTFQATEYKKTFDFDQSELDYYFINRVGTNSGYWQSDVSFTGDKTIIIYHGDGHCLTINNVTGKVAFYIDKL